MSLLIFLFVLFALVLVHEWGHFIVAKKTGMRVDEFGIGFPPKLFGIKRGETEYTFNALPIGGFVKIYGEDADAPAGSADYKRSFVGKNLWAQSAVLVAGVSMNVLFAWLLFSIAFMSGVQTSVSEEEATAEARLVITSVTEHSPAAEAGISPGVHINTVQSGEETLQKLTPTSFSEFVRTHGDTQIQVAYSKGGELYLASIQPQKGLIPNETDRPAVGVALSLIDTVRYPIHEAVVKGFTHTLTGIRDITVGIFNLISEAVMMRADLSQVAGPVGIVGLVGEASAFGVTALLLFTGFISLNLAVINLLPFPALDGGRLLFVIIEAIIRKPIPARVTQVLNTAGFAILILLMVVVTWNDIVRLM